MMLTAAQLAAMVPCSLLTAGTWLPHLEAAMVAWAINTPHRAAGWIANLSHESSRFGSFEENLNYSPQRLMAVWPRRFPTLQSAGQCAWNPQHLAERVYGGRMGNGPEGSGDGWKFRGRGPKQITGRANYRECGMALNLPLEDDPDLLLDPQHGANAAGWYWNSRGCNELMDRAAAEPLTKGQDGDFFEQVTRKINGGLIGHDDRIAAYTNACRVLGIKPGA